MSTTQQYDVLANHANGSVTNGSTDEAFDFSDTIILTAVGIDPATVIIALPDLSSVYLEGVDYELTVFENVVYITRIPGGNIPEGGSVRIQYLVASLPDYHVTQHGYANSVQIRFLKFFRAGYQVRVNRNRLESRFLITPFEEFVSRRRVLGFDSRFLTGEYMTEDYEGTRSVYSTRNWRTTVRMDVADRYRISYTISGSETDFLNTGYRTELKNQFVTFSWVMFNGFTGDVNYRDLDYQNNQYDRRRKSVLARIQWQLRKLVLQGSYEYILDDTDITRRRHSYYVFNIKRRF